MKEIMDFNRFGKYFVSDLKSCAVNYGYSLTLICLMGVIIYIGTVSMGLLFNGSWGGPTEAFRSNVFWMSMFVMAVTMPVKCYGGLTEKKRDGLLRLAAAIKRPLCPADAGRDTFPSDGGADCLHRLQPHGRGRACAGTLRPF